ncbi:hypothetical protein LY13_000386 [Prauserella aidingensis]|uniref:hypothetical protein n=1 Tax=Prauserella aidingensis TaxID=387890 RepID=UPI0020A61C94|nr:hypothetical protein [Prauserella aidingensis]MCP2251658.1 hypothetical protein [Prauserella aidingensis]
MKRLLATASIPPVCGQVSVHAPGTVDLPEWVTGEEPALASEHAVVIATQMDTDGDVVLSVLEGDGPEAGELVLDADLSFPEASLEFGSIVANVLHRVRLAAAGYTRVRVYADPPGLARSVVVVLDPGAES